MYNRFQAFCFGLWKADYFITPPKLTYIHTANISAKCQTFFYALNWSQGKQAAVLIGAKNWHRLKII